MLLPASGPITMDDVNEALGYSASNQLNLDDAEVRALFDKSSGAIKLSDGYGKGTELNPASVIDGTESAGSSNIFIETAEGSSAQAGAGVRVRSNGTIEAINGLTSAKVYTQFNSSTDWILPNSAGGGSWSVRCEQSAGNTMDGDALDTDHVLSSNREFYVVCPGVLSGNITIRDAQGTLYIKGPGGAVVAQIDFDFVAENDRE